MKQKPKVKFISSDKNLFYNTLRKRVDQYFADRNISQHANGVMALKTIILLLGYIIPFIIFIALKPALIVSLGLWLLMGISLAGIGMSVMHDANHGAYSSNATINNWLGYTLNLLGGSVFNWKLQHNVMHHTYTNIVDMDDDIEDKGILRFSPHTKLKIVHQLQYIYAMFMYGLITIYWVLAKDFVLYRKYISNGVNPNSRKANLLFLLRLILLKSFYFGIMLAVPTLIFSIPLALVISGFLLMHFVGGIILTVVFQLAHT
ncbi:MAG: acyl-CoA desaturase, partial [Sphingobacteriales bacterium]